MADILGAQGGTHKNEGVELMLGQQGKQGLPLCAGVEDNGGIALPAQEILQMVYHMGAV